MGTADEEILKSFESRVSSFKFKLDIGAFKAKPETNNSKVF
jgi:hypothetical protein